MTISGLTSHDKVPIPTGYVRGMRRIGYGRGKQTKYQLGSMAPGDSFRVDPDRENDTMAKMMYAVEQTLRN